MLHFVDGIDYDDPEDLVGSVHKASRVKPVWADERTGDIQDIVYFTPID